MSDELRKRNAALRAQIAEMRSQAAAAGIPLSTGGLDLGTGERVPEFKVLGLEFGDATPYEQRYEDLLEAKTNIGQQVAEYNRAQADAATAAADAKIDNIVAAAIPSPQEIAKANIEYRLATRGMDREDLRDAANLALGNAVKTQAALMPLNQLAGQLATERILNASQRFLAFKEGQPTAIQNRMATSGVTQANLQRATADQARAAAAMASLGAGRRFG